MLMQPASRKPAGTWQRFLFLKHIPEFHDIIISYNIVFVNIKLLFFDKIILKVM